MVRTPQNYTFQLARGIYAVLQKKKRGGGPDDQVPKHDKPTRATEKWTKKGSGTEEGSKQRVGAGREREVTGAWGIVERSRARHGKSHREVGQAGQNCHSLCAAVWFEGVVFCATVVPSVKGRT